MTFPSVNLSAVQSAIQKALLGLKASDDHPAVVRQTLSDLCPLMEPCPQGRDLLATFQKLTSTKNPPAGLDFEGALQRLHAVTMTVWVADCLESIAALETELEALKDPDQLSLTELRDVVERLQKAVIGLEETANGSLENLVQHVLDLSGELDDETFEGADQVASRLPSLLREVNGTLEILEHELGIRDQKDRERQERESLIARLDAFLAETDNGRAGLELARAVAAGAVDSALHAAGLESLSPAEYERVYQAAASALDEVVSLSRAWSASAKRAATFIAGIGEKRAEDVIRERVESLEGRIHAATAALRAEEMRLQSAFKRLELRESSLDVSPPCPIPPPPSFCSRRFQVGSKPSRELLDVLVSIDARWLTRVNMNPEIALWAPDDQVFKALLTVSEFRRRYEGRGFYVGFFQKGRYFDGYIPDLPESTKEADAKIPFTDLQGRVRSGLVRDLRFNVDLSAGYLNELDEDLRHPDSHYPYYKLKFYSTFLNFLPEIVDQLMRLFSECHDGEIPLSDFDQLRLRLLVHQFSNPPIRRELLSRLHAVTSPDAIRRRLARTGEKLPGFVSYSLREMKEGLRKNVDPDLDEETVDGFVYLYGFRSILSAQEPEEKQRMTAEILGRPIEEIAPELRLVGGVKAPLRSWTERKGLLKPEAAKEKIRHVAVLSGPDASFLIMGRANVRAVHKYMKTRLETQVEDVLCRPVALPQGGRGFRWVPLDHVHQSGWYGVFFRRLHLLAEKPTPVSDLVFRVFDFRAHPRFRPVWKNIVGLIMEDPGKDLSRDELMDRLGLWIMIHTDRLVDLPQMRELAADWRLNFVHDNA